jgi:hypothetical protein
MALHRKISEHQGRREDLGSFQRKTGGTQKVRESRPAGFPTVTRSTQNQKRGLNLFCVGITRCQRLGNLSRKEFCSVGFYFAVLGPSACLLLEPNPSRLLLVCFSDRLDLDCDSPVSAS